MNTLIKYFFGAFFTVSVIAVHAQPAKYTENNGHSHNDYEQNIPFLKAYYAGMGSIEADVFPFDGKLLVAHEKKQTDVQRTLDKLYLKPLAELYARNGGNAFSDSSRKLQLVVDIKENYQTVIPLLIRELKQYGDLFNPLVNRSAVRVVLSGDVPSPAHFVDYPEYIFFDGRPSVNYTPEQLKRVAMISDDMGDYTKWNGKGTLISADSVMLETLVKKAHAVNKPFRFWATKDSPNSWIQLEKLGVDWIGTDHPERLQEFYAKRDKLTYVNPKAHQVYMPSYKSDGGKGKVKNVILLIGDGMGLAQIQAGLTANFGSLNLGMFRYIGLSRTEAANSDITDSAAGGTAMACGEKTNNRSIGVDTAGRALASIADSVAGYGIKSGIISCGDITDATPAVFYAHERDRSMSFNIAADFAKAHVDVLVGSNRKSFTGNPDKTLMSRLKKEGFVLSSTLDQFESAKAGKQLVLLDDSVCRPIKDGRGDMLRASLVKTINLLSENKPGFFIMAEGAQIDYGGHANDLPYVIMELHDFDKAIGEALKFADADGETLVIVTADHETGGLSLLDASAAKGMVRGNFSSDDHTNVMVPVFAYGPRSSEFIGMYPNTNIYHKIVSLLTEREKVEK